MCYMCHVYVCTLQRALGITYTWQVLFWLKIQLLQCGLWASSPPTLALSAPSPTIPLSCSSWRHPPGIKARSHWLLLKNWLYGLFSPFFPCLIGSFRSAAVIYFRMLTASHLDFTCLSCGGLRYSRTTQTGALCCDYGYTDDLQERRWAPLIAPKSP